MKNVSTLTKYRNKLKKLSVDLHGGKCIVCGYARCLRALQFHHINPKDKSFNLSKYSHLSHKTYLEECKKCALLCSNCHCEVEEGLIELDFNQNEIIEKISNKIKELYKPKVVKIVEKKKRKSKCPSKETLSKMLWNIPMTEIASIFGVSDKAVLKWVKKHKLSKPSRGYWLRHSSVAQW